MYKQWLLDQIKNQEEEEEVNQLKFKKTFRSEVRAKNNIPYAEMSEEGMVEQMNQHERNLEQSNTAKPLRPGHFPFIPRSLYARQKSRKSGSSLDEQKMIE